MLACPVRIGSLPKLGVIYVDEAATDPISLECRKGRPRLRQSFGLLSLAAPNVGLFEVGAHIGLFALTFAAVGRRVVAIEASPRNAELLTRSAAENGFSELAVHNLAVSDRDGTLEFVLNGPYGFVSTDQSPKDLPPTTVPCVTLDSWSGAPAVSDQVVVKIDIEGHELHALRGMQRFLRERRLPPLFVESNAHCLDWDHATPELLRDTLSELGYRVYVTRRAWLRPWSREFDLHPWTPDWLQANTVENLFCVAPDDARVRLPRPKPSLTDSDFARELLRTARDANPANQRAAARVITRLSADRRRDRRIARVIDALSANPDPEIQRVVQSL